MEKDWGKVFSTADRFKAEIVKGILDQKHINCVLIDKKDSTYGTFGEVEVYVQRDNVLLATNVISKADL